MSNQPETSEEALDLKSDDSKQKDYDRIISAYKKMGSGNYDDVAMVLNLSDANVVSRRMKELRDMNILENTGEKTKTRRNRNAFVHKLTSSYLHSQLSGVSGAPAIKMAIIKLELF